MTEESKKSLKKFSKKGSMGRPEKGVGLAPNATSDAILTTAGPTLRTARTTAFSRDESSGAAACAANEPASRRQNTQEKEVKRR